MITAKAHVTNPNEAKLAITLEMPVGDWKRAIAQLDAVQHPGWAIASIIRKTISQSIEHVEVTREESE